MKTLTKVKVSAKGVSALPQAKARPGLWKRGLKPNPTEDKINKNTQIAPVIQDKMIQEVVDGVPPAEIQRKYEVSQSYVRDLLLRRFGTKEKMKEALTLVCYENALAFMGYASENIEQMTPRDAVMSAKMSIDAGLALEKSEVKQSDEIDFTLLISMGNTISRMEKRVEGTDRTLPAK